VRLGEVVGALDAYFRVPDVENDDWSETYDHVYPDPYWREFAEPGYEGRWNGLLVRGADEVEGAFTCVFPSDAIVTLVPARTLLSRSTRSPSRTTSRASPRLPATASSV
jgi:hypothetical protein